MIINLYKANVYTNIGRLYFDFGASIRIRTRTNGSEDHCAIHYTINAYYKSFENNKLKNH